MRYQWKFILKIRNFHPFSQFELQYSVCQINCKFEIWFWVEGMKIIQTKGEGLGLLIWVWVADHELANSTERDFRRFNRVWTWIIRDDLSPRWDQEKIIPIDLSTFRRRVCFEKLSPSARFEILSVGWGNVLLVVFEFELGVKINYNLILTFVIICL